VVTGINHITLAVTDVPRAFAFYTEVLGFKPLARWPNGAYLRAGDLWLAIEIGDPGHAPGDRSHLAFGVAATDFAALSARIRNSGAVIWQENRTEGDSLYFLDPDGRKLEVHASDLAARLASARDRPWEGLEFFD
jgi:catechol 2,3-dioxygenase-like lactoylglutathione lyase family enzyme